jgi:hypothetical protein
MNGAGPSGYTRVMIITMLLATLSAFPAPAQDDVADVASEERQAGKDPNKKYFLIGPRKEAREPESGWGLILVLPGGSGAATFNPFVRRIYKNAVPDGFLMAQLVAVEWTPAQAKTVVWPTADTNVPGMKFTTEGFVLSVHGELCKERKIDLARVYLLAWSSGGPPSYLLSLQKKRIVTGSFIAMSVFHPDKLDLTTAKGQAYYLYQSKDDKVTPFSHAEKAKEQLEKQEAKVELATYEGGHGWKGPIYKDLRAGFDWLEKNHADAEK